MNTTDLRIKVEDIIKQLEVGMAEVGEIEKQRTALESSGFVNSEREKKLHTKEIELKQKETDLASQQQYIEEQIHNHELLLGKIQVEKESLKSLNTQKQQLDQERLQLEADKKGLETLTKEKEQIRLDKEAFAKEVAAFGKEKMAMLEAQRLLELRETNIKQKEEKLDKIERMTQI